MEKKSRQRAAFADALAGVTGSLVALYAFYPLDVLKTNHQASSQTVERSTLQRQSISLSTLRERFYSGLSTKTLHTTASSFVYFYTDSFLVSWWLNRNRNGDDKSGQNKRVSTIARLVLSAVAAMINTCLTLPLDVLSARHQTSSFSENNEKVQHIQQNDVTPEEELLFHDTSMEISDSEYDDGDGDDQKQRTQEEGGGEEYISLAPYNLARSISCIIDTPMGSYDAKNIRSLWTGIWPSLLLCSNPSIHYTVFDLLKARVIMQRLRREQSLTMKEAFLVGWVAKFVATITTYPLIRAKVMLMVSSSEDKDKQSMMKCLEEEYRQNGIRGLYRGCNLQLFHTVLKSALLMMVRERITVTTRRLVMPATDMNNSSQT